MKTYEVLKLQLGNETRYYSDGASWQGFMIDDERAIAHFIANSKYSHEELCDLLNKPYLKKSFSLDIKCLDIDEFNGEYFNLDESEFEYKHVIDIGITKDGKKIKFLQNYD